MFLRKYYWRRASWPTGSPVLSGLLHPVREVVTLVEIFQERGLYRVAPRCCWVSVIDIGTYMGQGCCKLGNTNGKARVQGAQCPCRHPVWGTGKRGVPEKPLFPLLPAAAGGRADFATALIHGGLFIVFSPSKVYT